MDHGMDCDTLSEFMIRLVFDGTVTVIYCEMTSYRFVEKMFEQALKIMLGKCFKIILVELMLLKKKSKFLIIIMYLNLQCKS